MSKKSLNKKEAKKIIVESRESNITNQEIYNELTQKYHDKKGLATFITSIPRKEDITCNQYPFT